MEKGTDFLQQQGRLKWRDDAVICMSVQTITAGIQDLPSGNRFAHGLIFGAIPDLLDSVLVDVAERIVVETAGADIAIPGHIDDRPRLITIHRLRLFPSRRWGGCLNIN